VHIVAPLIILPKDQSTPRILETHLELSKRHKEKLINRAKKKYAKILTRLMIIEIAQ
jgi:hypothetical protein